MKTIFVFTLLLVCTASLLATPPAGKTRQFTSPDQIPEGLAKSDWSSIRAAYEAGLHAFQPVEGGWQARNLGQQWTAKFDRRGFLAQPRGGDWQWGLELKGYGFGEKQIAVDGTPAVKAEGQRLSYDWDASVQEWFVNDQRGLEHGFTVKARPEGATDAPLQFTLAVRGTLTAHLSADALGVEFRDAAGDTVLTYAGLKVWDADGKVLASRFEAAREKTMRLLVEERGARYPLTIDPIAQQAYVKPATVGTTQAGDYFGRSVAIEGDTVVVGAIWEDGSATGVNGTVDEAAADAGAAYVFVRSGATWSQQAYLKASQVTAGDLFGISVVIAGDTVVVGAWQEDGSATGVNGSADEDATEAGAAYVFVRSGTTWSQQAYLKASQVSVNDRFGWSVAVSGDTVVVGAAIEDGSATGVNGSADEAAIDAGAAYVFVRSGTTWSQQAYLKASQVTQGDHFGWSVAAAGDTVVVGATSEDGSATGVNGMVDELAISAGAAYVFVRNGTTWIQQAYLKASQISVSDSFGTSVAVAGDTVVVGAPYENGSATGVNGTVDEGVFDAGAAYVFVRSGTTWSQQAYLKASQISAKDYFGVPVAIAGDMVVVGADWEDGSATGVNGMVDETATDAGAVYVFARSGTTWNQQAYLKASQVSASDFFGVSVAVSGNTVVVGAWKEDGSTTEVNGTADEASTEAGAAYIFTDVVALVPTITGVSPSSGSTVGGTSVTITGSDFNGTTSVTIGGTAATDVLVVDDSTITATTPAHATGSVSILVTTPVGTNTANTLYTYVVPAPTVTGISPATGPTLGGTSVTITGTNLTGATAVTIGGAAATNVIVVNSTTITATTPPGSAGTASVLVTTAGGTNVTNTLYTYFVPLPDITLAQAGPLADGTAVVPFASVTLGSSGAPLTFTLANTGTAEVTSLVVTKDGPGAADFMVSDLSATSIPVAGTATFTVTFHPTSGGMKSAALHVASNVSGTKNPFDITLTGSGRAVGQASQMLVFNPPLKLHLAESPFTLSASASSGLPVAFSLISGPATLLGNVLTLNGPGTVKVRATQAGNADFLAATPVERTITVAANPTTLTLTNLSQTYTGTRRPITVLGATGAVDVTYKVGLNYVPEAPINVGSYPVKAVAGSVIKTGSLIINKAPLFVQPDDQRKFAGQANPTLTFSYSGFLDDDNAENSVSKAPVIATTATATSVGGLYPITASLGTTTNYLFVYLKGTMKVETFAASYEALLVDAGTQRPAAKLELTVVASSKSFTGKLTTPTETAAVALPGTLTTNPLTETATGTATVTKGANTYLVTVTLPLTGDFTTEAKLNGVTLGTATNGRKLLTLATGQTLSYIGTHSALLAPAAAGAGVPAGAGWAVATIDVKGLLKLTGKLADGTGLTASLAADVSSHPGYRLFIQPYTPARAGAFIAGAFTLKQHPDVAGRRFVAFEDAADLTWVKARRDLDTSYRAGFGPVSTRLTLDPWLPPATAKVGVPAITLTQRLGLTANQFTAQHSAISSASFDDLAKSLGLNATTNIVSVSAPLANLTKWKITVTPATGAFAGSFELTDSGKKRLVPFAGMMRQPPITDLSGLIGDGNFLLPSLLSAPNNEILSGEIGFER
jgi:hypothetical protein